MRQSRYEISTADRNWIDQIGWRCVDDVLKCSAGGVAAVSPTSDVVEVPVNPALGGPANVFVKRYRYELFEHRIKQMFRGTLFGKSRARREFEFLTNMRLRQVPTVRPIAYGDNYGRAFLRASFVITEGTAGFQSLDMFALHAIRHNPLTRSKRRRLTQGLATTIRNMHDAGIRHGGLYLRNILVREETDGEYDFLLIDPDTHGRLRASPVPEADAVADLSEVVSSAMALGQRTGLTTLMKAYFQVSTLTPHQKKLTAQIMAHALTLAPSERRRMAVTEAIGWFRQRGDRLRSQNPKGRAFSSVDDFFHGVSSGAADAAPDPKTSKVIRFSFSGPEGTFDRTVVVDGERITVSSTRPARQDLVIRTDPETWLAVVSGHADACARLRSGHLRMDGDTTVLGELMEHFDRTESTARAPGSNSGEKADAESEPNKDPMVMSTSPQSPQRQFGRKYKADDYARYYAEKHDSSVGRRISNDFERRMIRRSLLRIRRHHPFQSVLDCPSGTGRFLPTLASLDVSVIAMDTSDAVLREGKKHHGLFKNPPVTLAGSAFAIALPDHAVDVVLCSRLLHHIANREERVAILKEFARVARVGVVISFFDASSYRAWKRNRKAQRKGKVSGRHAITRDACVEEAVEAGLKPLGMNALLRFHTEVTAAAFLC